MSDKTAAELAEDAIVDTPTDTVVAGVKTGADAGVLGVATGVDTTAAATIGTAGTTGAALGTAFNIGRP
jgi:hypothetical protein